MFKLVSEGKHAPLSDAEFEKQFGVDQNGLNQLQKFANDNNLKMTGDSIDTKSGVVVLQGSAAEMEKAFNVQLNNYKSETGELFRSFDGKASVPTQLAPYINYDILGLDSRRVVDPHTRI